MGKSKKMRRRGRNGWIARLGPAIKIANLTGSPNAENYQVADRFVMTRNDSGKIIRLYCFRIARPIPMAV